MSELALAGLNVLDVSLNIGGAYCSKLLADLGAEVIAVEPPGGHPLRLHGPFPGDEPDPNRSGLFLHLFANKSILALDVGQEGARARLLGLAGDADLVIESFPPGELASRGLGFEELRGRRPGLVLTSITHFGQTGPYRHWQSEEIVDWALGGYMYFGGSADREPLMVPNNQSMLHAGAHGAIASLAALSWARRTGQGQHVDVSAVETLLSAHIWTVGNWTHAGKIMRRTTSETIRCKDGWVKFMMERFDPGLLLLIERPDLVDDPRFADRASWKANLPEIESMLNQWIGTHDKLQIFHGAQELRMPVTPVYDAADLVESAELKERDWFVDDASGFKAPGFPYKLSETPPSIRGPAPQLGEYVEGWAGEGAPRPSTASMSEPNGRLPLQGVRVLEITGNWAGPYAGRMLADLGADVLKIEDPKRPQGRTSVYAGNQPMRHHYNRSAYFNKLHRNKRSLTLDLSTAQGREVFLKLAPVADVVLENNSPRVMRNLGLEYSVLQEVNPGIIMASISAFGPTGTAGNYVAYGANIEASCGLSAVMGYADEERPYQTGLYYADPITAAHAVVAIQAALAYRERTGRGQHIDLSLHENGVIFFAEALLEYTVGGKVSPRRGNRHKRYAPQGCYPSSGDDMWMVLCVRSDEEWRCLARLIGDPELMAEEYATVQGRRRRHDRIDEIIARWTVQYDHNEAAALLQREGVPAAPVLANWEMVSNLHFHDRGFYVPVAHPEMGVFPYPGMPWKLSETPGSIRSASPLYGEHNTAILRDLLDLPEPEIAALYDQGIAADVPPPAIPPPFIIHGQ